MSNAPKRQAARRYRVNARLDARTREQLAELEAQTKLSTTDVVREALRRMHAELSASRSNATAALDRLVGRYAGAGDLSENVKAVLSDSLAKKHGR